MITELPNGFIGVTLPKEFFGSPWMYSVGVLAVLERKMAGATTALIYLPQPCDPIGMANGLSEEQAGLLVEDHPEIAKCYRDYQCDEWMCITAVLSLQSMLNAHNLNPNTTFILRKN